MRVTVSYISFRNYPGTIPVIFKYVLGLTINPEGDVRIKYKKKGTLNKTENEELVLTDGGNKSYKVDSVVAVVWNMCDGTRTHMEIADALAQKSESKRDEVKDAVLKIIAQLERFGLLERA